MNGAARWQSVEGLPLRPSARKKLQGLPCYNIYEGLPGYSIHEEVGLGGYWGTTSMLQLSVGLDCCSMNGVSSGVGGWTKGEKSDLKAEKAAL